MNSAFICSSVNLIFTADFKHSSLQYYTLEVFLSLVRTGKYLSDVRL